MKHFTRVLALAAIAAALFAVGCGDDDDDTTSSTTTTEAGATGATDATADTKEQWIATADEVCANADKEIERAVEQSGLSENSTPEEVTTFVETAVIPIQQSVVDTLRGLAPPEEEADQVSEILDEVQASIDTVSSDPDLLADPDAAETAFDEADQLAQDYGMQECGSSD